MKKFITLLLVLTGMVCTANAWTTVKLLNSVESKWDSSATTTMTDVGDGSNNYFYYILDSSTVTDGEGNYYFRIYCNDGKYYGAWEDNFAILDYTNYGGKESTYSFKLVTDKSSKYIISAGYWDDSGWKWHFTATKYTGSAKISYVNLGSDLSTVYAYAYCTGDAKLLGGWPGTAMTNNGDGTWSLDNVNIGKSTNFIFNNNSDKQYPTSGGFAYNANGVYDKTGVAADQTITLGTSGIGTYSSAYPLDFPLGSDVTPYTVSSLSKTAATLTKVDNQAIPAQTGLIVMGDPNATQDFSPKATTTSVGQNKLQPSVTATAVAADYAYVLSGGVFHPANAGTIPANKAFLLKADIDAVGGAHSLDLMFDNTTGINTTNVANNWLNGDFYNLAGQRVVRPTKGLYIVNGKKVIIK